MENSHHIPLGKNPTKTREQIRNSNLSYPYGRSGKGHNLNKEQVATLEGIKPLLNGLTYREAADIVDVLKEQLTDMTIVSI
ncbi:hypothetical protein [Parapedobacter soli]|uniref:hypothetical protein n=1 Tax=Parapedobacter soli TaxID=416955 RepID=UPI0021C7FEAF|nr:hypothetical protein [Parapedobacter soli]